LGPFIWAGGVGSAAPTPHTGRAGEGGVVFPSVSFPPPLFVFPIPFFLLCAAGGGIGVVVARGPQGGVLGGQPVYPFVFFEELSQTLHLVSHHWAFCFALPGAGFIPPHQKTIFYLNHPAHQPKKSISCFGVSVWCTARIWIFSLDALPTCVGFRGALGLWGVLAGAAANGRWW